MKDINGGEFREGGMAMLLCEVVAIEESGVRARVMNSTEELLVGAKHDEVLGGLVADSELTAFDPTFHVGQAVVNALKECYVDLGGLLVATTDELAPKVREELQRAHDLAERALGLGPISEEQCPMPSK
jgi:hypothetical protein